MMIKQSKNKNHASIYLNLLLNLIIINTMYIVSISHILTFIILHQLPATKSFYCFSLPSLHFTLKFHNLWNILKSMNSENLYLKTVLMLFIWSGMLDLLLLSGISNFLQRLRRFGSYNSQFLFRIIQ